MSDPRPSLLIEDLPEDDRPRERLVQKGVRALSDAELLAVLLGNGLTGVSAIDLAQQVLIDLGGFSGIHREDISRLLEIKGVGLAKAARIKAAVEVGYRLSTEERGKSWVIKAPQDLVDMLGHDLRGSDQEEFWVVWLNARNVVSGSQQLYKGSQDATTVRVSEVFKLVVSKNANAVMLAHNHPSGDPTESPEDVNMTRAIIEAGKLLDIRVLDHVVIGMNSFTSIRQKHPSLWA
ncbi:MAG: DNA repair protein RadC [Anaerolineaceae bacterium]|nr:DNA repair protein RadC [Anaerolineaceae bacterium]